MTDTRTSAPTPPRAIPAGWMLAALALGLGLGAILAALSPASVPTAVAIVEPFGRVWLAALTMTIVPLVFGLLVAGGAGAARSAATSRMAGRAMLWFVGMLVAAATLGALAVTGLVALWPVPEGAAALRALGGAAPATEDDWITGFLPMNPVAAAAATAMVPLVFFALIFGLASARIEPVLAGGIETAMRALTATMLVIVRWVLLAAPIGIFALAFAVGARTGVAALGTLIHYVIIVCAGCFMAVVLSYAAVAVAGRMSPIAFGRAAAPAQAVALGTQSSLATLPAMIAAAGAMAVPAERAGLVLPLAVSIFRAATSAGNVAVAVYLAHLYGNPPDAATLAIGIGVSAAVSLAAVGLPSQVSFFTALAPVCLAMGVPVTLLPLLLAIETIPDLFRTLGNVTADLAVTRIVGRERAVT